MVDISEQFTFEILVDVPEKLRRLLRAQRLQMDRCSTEVAEHRLTAFGNDALYTDDAVWAHLWSLPTLNEYLENKKAKTFFNARTRRRDHMRNILERDI